MTLYTRTSVALVKTYTVRRGDVLYSIALKVYGTADTTSWRRIAAANNITNPESLTPGTVLVIP